MKFITRSTKIQSIVASVLTALALITLIMLSTLLEISNVSKLTMTFIYTVSLVLALLIWHGIIQIKVFNDYRCKKNYLCADGILSLCMGVLIIVSAILLGTLQISQVMNGIFMGKSDIRIFLTSFAFIIAIWKSVIAGLSIKEKRFNWWCELLFAFFWLMLSIFCLTSMFVKGSSMAWAIIGSSWGLIVLTIFYILYSYVIRTPEYLETDEIVEQLREELEEAAREKKEKAQIKNQVNSSFRLQDKLKKLKDLKDQGLITEKEYTYKKNQLLDSF